MNLKQLRRCLILVFFILLIVNSANAELFYVGRTGKEPGLHNDELMKDEQVKAARKEWLIAQYKEEIENLKENRKLITNVNRIGYIIFAVVHIILFLAIGAAVQEFIHARKTRRRKPEQHEIQISMEGIALRSSLHGMALLAIAALFYFLFLKFVLPMNSLPEKANTASETSKANEGVVLDLLQSK